jgi:cytochrome c peroxidase
MTKTTYIASLFSVLALAAIITASNRSDTSEKHSVPSTENRVEGSKITEAEKIALGKAIFFDTELSEPAGQACASCHDPKAGFANPDHRFATSKGAVEGLFGERNAPTIAYSHYSPEFYYDGMGYIGGQFLDGRAATLEAQSEGPPLNPVEMHNPDPSAYAAKFAKAPYAGELKRIYGPSVFATPKQTMAAAADALATYERSSEVAQFTSKFDAYLRGKAKLTPKELKGLKLFNSKANCWVCHPSSNEDLTTVHGLFTEYDYHNLGVPKNRDNRFYSLPEQYNPDGTRFIDIGLARNPAVIAQGRASESRGKFKTPTLRNIALTAPYMHNGVFKSLKEVVSFYNTRDLKPSKWGKPEIEENIENEVVGNLRLTSEEEEAIVAFLLTLTDGYSPSSETK